MTIGLFNLRQAPAVDAQKDMALTNWQVLQDEAGSRFLLGYLPNQQTLRMTTPIQRFDPGGRSLQTESGRRYQLRGAPASDATLLAMMAVCAVGHGLLGAVDVTGDVWRSIELATH